MADPKSHLLEVELKYQLDQNRLDSIQNIRRWLDLNAMSRGENELDNTYFDTKDFSFHKNRVGLRIRQDGKKREQTLKFAGTQTGAMSQRPEFNVNIYSDTPKPELERFKACAGFELYWPENWDMETIQAELRPTFQVIITRAIWDYESEGLSAEIAFDQGWIISGAHQVEICEIEWELKQGNPQLMQQIGDAFAMQFHAQAATLSKAQRGFALLGLA